MQSLVCCGSVACAQGVGDYWSVVGDDWSQLEWCVVYYYYYY
jgi:hypothetical protein